MGVSVALKKRRKRSARLLVSVKQLEAGAQSPSTVIAASTPTTVKAKNAYVAWKVSTKVN